MCFFFILQSKFYSVNTISYHKLVKIAQVYVHIFSTRGLVNGYITFFLIFHANLNLSTVLGCDIKMRNLNDTLGDEGT